MRIENTPAALQNPRCATDRGRDTMAPRMKPRKKGPSPNLLRILLALWAAVSLSYWAAGTSDLWSLRVHWDQQVRAPFSYDWNTRLIESVEPEAAKAGLAAGDRVQELNGAPYAGVAQWIDVIHESRPGDILEVGFVRPGGQPATATLSLERRPWPFGNTSAMIAFWRDFFLTGFLPLICLLIGFWVVVARPTDRNAWLLLVLLTFPSVAFLGQLLATGAGLLLRNIWLELIQLAAPPALLLFGVYFPERSRIDARARWVKWILLGVFGLCVCILFPLLATMYYAGGNGPFWAKVGDFVSSTINYLNLLFVILYLVLTLDKLRSASTADARRRLRVLTAGMVVGVGTLLVVFVLLPHYGITENNLKFIWLRYLGALVFMVAPLTLAYVVVVQRALDVRALLRMGTRYALARVSLWVVQVALLTVIGLRLLRPVMQSRQPQPSDFAGALVFLALILVLRFGVRDRLRRWVDRQFFREAYNAEVMLNELSVEVPQTTETRPLLQTVAQRVCQTLHVNQIALLLRRGDGFYLEQAIGVAPDGTLALPAKASSVRFLMNSNEPARLYRSDPDAWYLMAGSAERHALDQLHAELLVPLPGRNRLMGIMTLGPKRSEAAWSRTDLQVL